MSDRDAKAAAERDLNERVAVLGPTTKFPMERLYFGAKRRQKSAYVVPTAEGYSRVWEEFSGLAKELAVKDKNLVGLLTLDLSGNKSDPNIARLLNKPGVTLPDGTVLNLPLKSVADVEKDIEVSRVWKQYTDYKNLLNKAAKDAKYASYSSVKELREALQQYAKDLCEASDSWCYEYNSRESEDVAYKYAYGLSKIVKDKTFMDKHGNTPLWTQAEAIMRYRDDYVKFYKDTPTGYKSVVVNAWRDYINSIIDVIDPKLAELLDRYFEKDNLTEVKIG
jgi:hypothetical protein